MWWELYNILNSDHETKLLKKSRNKIIKILNKGWEYCYEH